jgi:NAD-dependent histone deacetylase SIR2
MSLNPQPAVHEIRPDEGYDIDSDEFESEDEGDMIPDDEYDQLMEEGMFSSPPSPFLMWPYAMWKLDWQLAENGFTEEEMHKMAATLKEVGLVTFLRDYLRGGDGDEIPSLRKLILGFGIIPVSPKSHPTPPNHQPSYEDKMKSRAEQQPISLRHPSTPNLALLPFTKLALSRILRRRQKLPQYNTIEDAIHLLKTRKNIIVLTGAGISTSCGIPDFRSSEGLYAKLQEEGRFDLDDPQQMFDIGYFREHPEVF